MLTMDQLDNVLLGTVQSSKGGDAQIVLNTNYQKKQIAQIRPHKTYRSVIQKLYVGCYSKNICSQILQKGVLRFCPSLEGAHRIRWRKKSCYCYSIYFLVL